MEQVNCLVMTGIGGGSFRGVKILRCKNRQWQDFRYEFRVAGLELRVKGKTKTRAGLNQFRACERLSLEEERATARATANTGISPLRRKDAPAVEMTG